MHFNVISSIWQKVFRNGNELLSAALHFNIIHLMYEYFQKLQSIKEALVFINK